MDRYLILARCGIDDLPLTLHADFETAESVAKKWTRARIIEFARTTHKLDVSVVECLTIAKFEDDCFVGFIRTIELPVAA